MDYFKLWLAIRFYLRPKYWQIKLVRLNLEAYTQKSEQGAQIDLLLDRQDRCINVCEMKFSTAEYVIEKKGAAELGKKVNVFITETGTKKTIFPTLITTYGAKKNEHYLGRVQAEVLMEDLFK